MNALELLRQDHDTVRALFDRFRKAEQEDDQTTMQSVAKEIFSELEVHTGIEEDVFYPAAREEGGEIEELVLEGIEEHHVVDVLLGEIRALTPDDERWTAKMTVLIENVEHHAEEEEEELFPKLREGFGDERLEQLGEQLEQAKLRRAGGTSKPTSDDMSRDELYEQAKEQDIPGRSEMNKDELREAVEEG